MREVPTEELHLLVEELQDERARSRLREAFWISIIVHMVFLIALALSPKWLPARTVVLATPAELMQQKDLRFLELPPDQQRIQRRPETNIISDRDRIATSRTPSPDRRQLEELLRDNRRPGAPAPPAQPPVAAQAVPPTQAAPQPQTDPGAEQPRYARPEDANQLARLEQPPLGRAAAGAFGGGMSAGSAIEQAARATAARRGVGGEYGSGPARAQSNVGSQLDVLSDTMGVDFGPYLSRVLQSVRENWYNLIPEVARPPLMKSGKVSIEFAILKDGSVGGMRLVGPSGDVSLDRAAWGGITASHPFQPLPTEFRGQYLALRFHFYYNPQRNELK